MNTSQGIRLEIAIPDHELEAAKSRLKHLPYEFRRTIDLVCKKLNAPVSRELYGLVKDAYTVKPQGISRGIKVRYQAGSFRIWAKSKKLPSKYFTLTPGKPKNPQHGLTVELHRGHPENYPRGFTINASHGITAYHRVAPGRWKGLRGVLTVSVADMLHHSVNEFAYVDKLYKRVLGTFRYFMHKER